VAGVHGALGGVVTKAVAINIGIEVVHVQALKMVVLTALAQLVNLLAVM